MRERVEAGIGAWVGQYVVGDVILTTLPRGVENGRAYFEALNRSVTTLYQSRRLVRLSATSFHCFTYACAAVAAKLFTCHFKRT